MKFRATSMLVAVLAASVLAAPVGAVPVPEAPTEQDLCRALVSESQKVFTGGVGEIWNWRPNCVNVYSGGTVTWHQVDALPHRAVAKGCFDTNVLSSADADGATLKFSYIAASNAVKVTGIGTPKICELGAFTQQREGAATALISSTGPFLPVVEDLGDALEIHYICAIHGAKMHATVIVEKTAA